MLSRTLGRVLLGVSAGGALVALIGHLIEGLTVTGGIAITGYLALMTLVCLFAAVVPLRRALGVQPMEALRVQ